MSADPSSLADGQRILVLVSELSRLAQDYYNRVECLPHSIERVTAQTEAEVARLAISITGSVGGFETLRTDLEECKTLRDIGWNLDRLITVINAQIKRWGWSYILSPDGESDIHAKLESHRRKRETPFLRAAVGWRSKPGLEPHDFADAMAERARALGLKPDRPAGACEEERFWELHRAWMTSPALGRAPAKTTEGELLRLAKACDALRSIKEQLLPTSQASTTDYRVASPEPLGVRGVGPEASETPVPPQLDQLTDVELRNRAVHAWKAVSSLIDAIARLEDYAQEVIPSVLFFQGRAGMVGRNRDIDLEFDIDASITKSVRDLGIIGINSPSFIGKSETDLSGLSPNIPFGLFRTVQTWRDEIRRDISPLFENAKQLHSNDFQQTWHKDSTATREAIVRLVKLRSELNEYSHRLKLNPRAALTPGVHPPSEVQQATTMKTGKSETEGRTEKPTPSDTRTKGKPKYPRNEEINEVRLYILNCISNNLRPTVRGAQERIGRSLSYISKLPPMREYLDSQKGQKNGAMGQAISLNDGILNARASSDNDPSENADLEIQEAIFLSGASPAERGIYNGMHESYKEALLSAAPEMRSKLIKLFDEQQSDDETRKIQPK